MKKDTDDEISEYVVEELNSDFLCFIEDYKQLLSEFFIECDILKMKLSVFGIALQDVQIKHIMDEIIQKIQLLLIDKPNEEIRFITEEGSSSKFVVSNSEPPLKEFQDQSADIKQSIIGELFTILGYTNDLNLDGISEEILEKIEFLKDIKNYNIEYDILKRNEVLSNLKTYLTGLQIEFNIEIIFRRLENINIMLELFLNMIQVPFFFVYYEDIYGIISLLIDKIIQIKNIFSEQSKKNYGDELVSYSKGKFMQGSDYKN